MWVTRETSRQTVGGEESCEPAVFATPAKPYGAAWMTWLSCGVLLWTGIAACDKTRSTPPPAPIQQHVAQAEPAYEQLFERPGFELRLSLAALPNLLYHLDCLSGSVPCSTASYQTLWSKLGLSADDSAALAQWQSLRARHGGSIRADAQTAALPLLAPGGWVDLAERQRIATLRSESLDAFEASYALLTSDAVAHALRQIAARFEARFQQYWQGQGRAAGVAYVADLARLLGDEFFLGTLARLARFEGQAFDASAQRVYRLHLLVQPAADKHALRAYQLESDFAIEAPEHGKALDLIDVVAHELCHALLLQMPALSKEALVDAFLRSDDPYSLVDYGLLDEALATGIGNGLLWRHFHPDEDFEAHRARNFHSLYRPAAALAVALLPKLEALLADDATMATPKFVRTLGDAARASYREHGPMPIDYLHSHVLIAPPAFEAASSKVRDAAFAGFPYLRELKQLDAEAKYYLQQHPQLSAAVYLPSTAPLPELLTAVGMEYHRSAELQELVARDRGVVYAMRLTPKAYLFLFVASDEASAGELADKFIALREMRDGALIELPR